MDQLIRARSIALGHAIDLSTKHTYSSHLHSYLTFCRLHNFPVTPTADTLSFYVVYMCAHIEPRSVDSYLSGICHELEEFFPDVRQVRASRLVSKSLKGCKRMFSKPIMRKRALTTADLVFVHRKLSGGASHNDMLFLAMLVTGFHALMRLGEMTLPDKVALRNPAKLTLRLTVQVAEDHFQFLLPAHKADPLFEGNHIVVKPQRAVTPPPVATFVHYLQSRDARFPYHPHLWLTDAGQPPTRAWFNARLRMFFPSEVSGHSLRAGGATWLAENGALPHMIQAAGRWSSDSWTSYVRKHPMLYTASLFPHLQSPSGQVV